MATDVRVPVEEYLATSYEPDREYVDGILVERNVGEHDHSLIQTLLMEAFLARRREWNIRVFPQQRIRVREQPKTWRIPDLCVMKLPYRRERFFTEPPLLVIEILSPDDRWSEVRNKVNDYRGFGVPHIWIVDPERREVWVAEGEGLRHHGAGAALAIPEIGGSVDFDPIFRELD
jgi:Uma2 family endonuclease